jgi:double-stranded uracil-DNA glycosylase
VARTRKADRDPLDPAASEEAVRGRPESPGHHRTTIEIDGRRYETLDDLPPVVGRLLFVGLNPSPVSVDAGHYHQGPLGRRFWRRLIAAGILPEETELDLACEALAAAGHGITDIHKRPSPRDDADPTELRAGVAPLWMKVTLWRPAAVVFIYKRGAEAAAGRRLTERWGHLEGVALAGRPCFLMPAPYASAEETAEGLNLIRNLATAILPPSEPDEAIRPALESAIRSRDRKRSLS